MKRIYKYQLDGPECSVRIPIGYEILSVINQRDQLTVYAMIDREEEMSVEVNFYTIGTGWDINDSLLEDVRFLGTVSTENGRLIWHVFTDGAIRGQQ